MPLLPPERPAPRVLGFRPAPQAGRRLQRLPQPARHAGAGLDHRAEHAQSQGQPLRDHRAAAAVRDLRHLPPADPLAAHQAVASPDHRRQGQVHRLPQPAWRAVQGYGQRRDDTRSFARLATRRSAGPYVWGHPPVEENCLTCHNPHGSNHARLLCRERRRTSARTATTPRATQARSTTRAAAGTSSRRAPRSEHPAHRARLRQLPLPRPRQQCSRRCAASSSCDKGADMKPRLLSVLVANLLSHSRLRSPRTRDGDVGLGERGHPLHRERRGRIRRSSASTATWRTARSASGFELAARSTITSMPTARIWATTTSTST